MSKAQELSDALDRMDNLLNPEYRLLSVPGDSATAIASRADMAMIRSALSASSEQQAAQQDAERDQAIGRAVQRACKDLPEGSEVVIHLEKGAGTVYMNDWDGNEYDHFQSDEGFGDVINQAVDGAIAADVAARASNGGKT